MQVNWANQEKERSQNQLNKLHHKLIHLLMLLKQTLEQLLTFLNLIALQPHKYRHKLNHLASLNLKKLNPNLRSKSNPNLRSKSNPNLKLFLRSKPPYNISQLIKDILNLILKHLKVKIFTTNHKPQINMSNHKLLINT